MSLAQRTQRIAKKGIHFKNPGVPLRPLREASLEIFELTPPDQINIYAYLDLILREEIESKVVLYQIKPRVVRHGIP